MSIVKKTGNINFLGYSGYGYLKISDIDSYNTKYTVSWSVGFHNSAWFQQGSGHVYSKVTATDHDSNRGSYSTSSTVSAGSHKIDGSTYSFRRTHSDRTIKITAKVSFNGDSGTTSWSHTIPARPHYTVSYSGNGSDVSNVPSSQTKWYDETLTLSSKVPTRSGYAFIGWGISSTDTSANYSAGGSYKSNRSIKLYAIWKALTHTVTFYTYDGTVVFNTITKTNDKSITIPMSVPTKTNYDFVGWNTDVNWGGSLYQPGETLTSDSITAFYAEWKLQQGTVYIMAPTGVNDDGSYIDFQIVCTLVGDGGDSFVMGDVKISSSYKVPSGYEMIYNKYLSTRPEYCIPYGGTPEGSESGTYGYNTTKSYYLQLRDIKPSIYSYLKGHAELV